MIHNSENEIAGLGYENFNQKVLVNSGVCCYFGNAFSSNGEGKLPMIKSKLRKILVDFGLVQTCVEINQELGYVKVYFRDELAKELKELFVPLRRDNKVKESQAIELVISIEGQSCTPPEISRGIKTYTGLTKLLFQEFIQPTKSVSMIDNNPYNEIREIIKHGNLSPSEPLQSIFGGEVD